MVGENPPGNTTSNGGAAANNNANEALLMSTIREMRAEFQAEIQSMQAELALARNRNEAADVFNSPKLVEIVQSISQGISSSVAKITPLAPGQAGAPLFTGTSLTEFLKQFELCCKDWQWEAEHKAYRMFRYAAPEYQDTLQELDGYETNWEVYKDSLHEEYGPYDTKGLTQSRLNHLIAGCLRSPETTDMEKYLRDFKRISNHLIECEQLTVAMQVRELLRGLPLMLQKSVMNSFEGLGSVLNSTNKKFDKVAWSFDNVAERILSRTKGMRDAIAISNKEEQEESPSLPAPDDSRSKVKFVETKPDDKLGTLPVDFKTYREGNKATGTTSIDVTSLESMMEKFSIRIAKEIMSKQERTQKLSNRSYPVNEAQVNVQQGLSQQPDNQVAKPRLCVGCGSNQHVIKFPEICPAIRPYWDAGKVKFGGPQGRLQDYRGIDIPRPPYGSWLVDEVKKMDESGQLGNSAKSV